MHDGLSTETADSWALTPDEDFDRVTSIARRVFDANAVMLFDASLRPEIVSAAYEHGVGQQVDGLDRDHIATSIALADIGDDERLSGDARLLGDTTCSGDIWLAVPVHAASGRRIGVLVVSDPNGRLWTDKESLLLKELGRSIATHAALHQEASARRRAENAIADSECRFVAMADQMPGLVFERRKVAREDARYAFFGSSDDSNPPCLRDFMQGGALHCIHPDDRDRFGAALRKSTADETGLDLTFRTLDPDKRVRWFRSRSVVRRDLDGAAIWDGFCFDISDLVEARESADTARRVKDALLVDVNHELRAPLQAIVGFTEFLKTETRPEVVRTHAQTIQSASQSLLLLVNQLLDWAGAEGAVTVDRSPTVLESLATTCLSMVAPLALEKHIGSHLVIDSGVPRTVLADGQKIQQILVNLLNNAIKFTNVGSVTLRISREADRLTFRVVDTGIGIPEDKIAMLFQRFSRIEPDNVSMRGTGLGLAIAKRLVELMGGTIDVSSDTERGTTFWFEIVAQETDESHAEAPPHRWQPAAPTGARILIADDLDLNRKLIADMLSTEGHEIDCVSDGAEAVRAAGSRYYDLILMDMIMPVMDGLTATREIRALPAPACDVAIIALTAHSFKEQLDSCLAAGMNATITKPMSLDTLTATVRNWTRGKTRAA